MMPTEMKIKTPEFVSMHAVAALDKIQHALNSASVENKLDMADHSMTNLHKSIHDLIMQSWKSDLPNDGNGFRNFDENGGILTSPVMYLCIWPWVSSRLSGPRGSDSEKGILNLLG